ncbi:hypothetical protein ACIGO9_36715 [Nocardia asteroides]|uniref:hypothetical protein n=1 Tax=Nocardia asteroides TaxID=1824 RepID=UPI0037CC99F3
MGRRKTASEMVDELAGMGEEIRQRAVDETREGVAHEIRDQFVGGPKVSRRTYGGKSPAACIEETLDYMKSADQPPMPPELAAVAEQIEQDGVPEAFTAGVQFAVRCMEDLSFEF